jgi:uncharacterized protein YxjI
MLFKQRLSAWFDKFEIFDEAGNTLYTVRGRFSFGKHLTVFDVDGNEVGVIKEEIMTMLPKYNVFLGENLVGTIRKEFTFFKPKFTIDFNGWSVEGNFLELDYSVFNSCGQRVATVCQELLNWTDTYSIEVVNSSDAILVLMLVLAIDANKASRS